MLGLEIVIGWASRRGVQTSQGDVPPLESRTLARIGSEQRFRTKDPRTLRQETCAQCRRKKRLPITPRIEVEKQTTVRSQEPRTDIVDAKFPISGSPFFPCAIYVPCDPVKTNAMRRDQIELFSKIGQRNLRMNARDRAPHVQQRSRAAKEWFFVSVEADSFVAEKTADVEEISRAASKVENAQRRSAVEPEILGALDVDAYPVSGVFVRVDPSRVRPIRIMFAQPF